MNIQQQISELYAKQQEKDWQYIPFYKVECFWKIGKLLFTTYGELIEAEAPFKAKLKMIRQSNPTLPEVAKLYKMARFYSTFPDFNKLSPLLTWSHYLILALITDVKARQYYYQEAIEEKWTLQQLQQAIDNQQFQRVLPLVLGDKQATIAHSKTYFQFSFLKKFKIKKIPESALESALVEQLQAFLVELGKGFAFVARQKRLITPNGKQLFVDLLFYNFLLKRFVLIDLKVVPLTYEHIGQMDMYCRLFNESSPIRDMPACLGIVLCPHVDSSLLHYSLLKDHPSIFAFEYTLDKINPSKHQKRQQKKEWEQALYNR